MDHAGGPTDQASEEFRHGDGRDEPLTPVDGRPIARPSTILSPPGCIMTGDRELLDELNRLGDALSPFVFGILTDSLSTAEQVAFGYQLIALAGRIRGRVEKPLGRRSPSVDGDVE